MSECQIVKNQNMSKTRLLFVSMCLSTSKSISFTRHGIDRARSSQERSRIYPSKIRAGIDGMMIGRSHVVRSAGRLYEVLSKLEDGGLSAPLRCDSS